MLVFETGLPTRYYLNRTEVDLTHLIPTDTVTACPYKGTTSGYWTAQLGDTTHPDIAWTYDFPTRALLPIAGLIAFYNEKVDTFLDGRLLDRPVTHFLLTAYPLTTRTLTIHLPHTTKSEDPMTVRLGLLALLEAKPGKGDDLAAFLQAGRELAVAEEGTVTWYAFKISDTSYGIFDTFETDEAREPTSAGRSRKPSARSHPTCWPRSGHPHRRPHRRQIADLRPG